MESRHRRCWAGCWLPEGSEIRNHVGGPTLERTGWKKPNGAFSWPLNLSVSSDVALEAGPSLTILVASPGLRETDGRLTWEAILYFYTGKCIKLANSVNRKYTIQSYLENGFPFLVDFILLPFLIFWRDFPDSSCISNSVPELFTYSKSWVHALKRITEISFSLHCKGS